MADAPSLRRLVASGLAAFLPAPRSDGRRPSLRRFQGAALVADASGFAALAAALEAEHGARGADRLAALMSEVLGGAAEVVAEHGGLVVDLVGDGLQAVWIEDEDAVVARQRAEAAAEALRAWCDSHARGVSLRIGVGAGDLEAALIGGVGGRWDTLTWGPALAAAADPAAPAPAAAAPRAESAPESAPETAETAEAVDPALLLPEMLRELADVADLAWSSELRRVSVLFVRLLPAGAHIDVDQVHRMVRRVQELAEVHEGVLDKVVADEKGVIAILAFGLPPTPIEGAAERAVATALALRAALPEASSGVATGKVFLGVVGGRSRGQYTLYGPAANRAARLMAAAAPGVAFCDLETREGGGAATFLPIQLTLKGLGAVAAFGLSGLYTERLERPAHLEPLCGRGVELARLARFLAGETYARRLLLSGGPGLGKSALVAAATAGMAPVRTARPSPGVREPLAAWRPAAREALRQRAEREGLGEDELLRALAAQAKLPPEAVTLAEPLFGRARGEAQAPLGDAERTRAVRRAQAVLLSALLGPAPLVVVDDADRLDEASLALAEELAEVDSSARLLVTARDPAGRALYGWLAERDTGVERIALAPLDRRGMAELVAAAAPAADDHPLVDWVFTRCRGNPQLGRELLSALPREALVAAAASPGAWRELSPQLALADMPPSIEAAIMARVSRLPNPAQITLRAASVFGRAFTAQHLLDIGGPLSRRDLEAALELLGREGLLQPNEGRWAFAQELVRETLHAALTEPLRRDLHQRAAERIEGQGGFDRAAELGRHWREAGRPRRAARYLRAAGRAALRAGAPGDAARFLREAIETAAAASPGGPLLAELAAALTQLNEREAAIETGYRALAAFGWRPPRGSRGWAGFAALQAAALARLLMQRRRRPGTRAARYQARLVAQTAYGLADMLLFSLGPIATAGLSLLAARVAEAADDEASAGRAYAFLGYMAGLLRLEGLARFILRRARRAATGAKAWDDLHFVIGAELWLAVTFARWPEAEAAFAELAPLHARTRGTYGLRIETTLRGEMQWLRGEPDAALASWRELASLARASGDDEHLSWAHAYEGRHWLWAGDLGRAEACFRESERLQERSGQPLRLRQGPWALTRVRLDRGEEVRGEADALLTDLADRARWVSFGADAAAALAEALIALHARERSAASERLARRAVADGGRFARLFPTARAAHALQAGALAAVQGRPAAAARAWRGGLRRAEAAGLDLDRMRLLDALAACPALAASDRATARREAEALAARCALAAPPRLHETFP